MLVDYKSDSGLYHWRKFVKNIGWANQNIGGQKVVKVIDAWAFINYWGAHALAALPKPTPMVYRWVGFSQGSFN